MPEPFQPSDIAREALRRLAARQEPPTPENFAVAYHEVAGLPAPDRAAWAPVIRDILAGLSSAEAEPARDRRRAALQRILADAPNMPLLPRLRLLTRNWETGAPGQPRSAELLDPLRQALAQLLQTGFAGLLMEDRELDAESRALAEAVLGAPDAETLQALMPRLAAFISALQWAAEDQAEIKEALLHVLELVVENIRELVADDAWMEGQLALLRELFDYPPGRRQIREVEARLQDVLGTQGALREKLRAAREEMQALLTAFLGQLARFAESTGEYQAIVGEFANRMESAGNLTDLSALVREVVHETRSLHAQALGACDDLQTVRSRAEDAEREIARLQSQLSETSRLLRQDHLTGTLNRAGFEEILEREVSRAHRRASPLCLAVLDVDNFKRLNDTHGHAAGDNALVHLARIMRESLRPHDTVARYGGEEFVILLPDAELHQAVAVLTRLQRELTRRYFLHETRRVLITFSAGVTRLHAGEDGKAALTRADGAMYQAKENGKNRVCPQP